VRLFIDDSETAIGDQWVTADGPVRDRSESLSINAIAMGDRSLRTDEVINNPKLKPEPRFAVMTGPS
jgi:hypothetical protein